MSKQQLRLHRGKKGSGGPIDGDRVQAFREGKLSLRRALGVPQETLGELRAQAEAFYTAGKWQQCVDVLMGLWELEELRPIDPVLLSRCFEELGDAERASVCAKIAHDLLDRAQESLGHRGAR